MKYKCECRCDVCRMLRAVVNMQPNRVQVKARDALHGCDAGSVIHDDVCGKVSETKKAGGTSALSHACDSQRVCDTRADAHETPADSETHTATHTDDATT